MSINCHFSVIRVVLKLSQINLTSITFIELFGVLGISGIDQKTTAAVRPRGQPKIQKPKKFAPTYSVTNQFLKKFSYGFWDNQWFGRNQRYLKLKLGAPQFMPGIKNLNLIFV
jgi:hypothetical protein